MEFWASAEVYRPAYPALDKARRCVSPFLNSALNASSLAALEIKLRYIPIAMPKGMREDYPARSRLRKKEKLYDCSPQLNYEVFVEGSFEDQLREYLRGIALSVPYLATLGATPQQVEEFEAILAEAFKTLTLTRPDKTQH